MGSSNHIVVSHLFYLLLAINRELKGSGSIVFISVSLVHNVVLEYNRWLLND